MSKLQLKKMSRTIVDYTPWIISGSVIGAFGGYEISEHLPTIVSGPYYVEQVLQNFVYGGIGASFGSITGTGIKFLANREKMAKTVAFYAKAVVGCGGLGYLVGKFSEENIINLIDIKSQFMGIEKSIAGDLIMGTLTLTGIVIGAGGVYLHNKLYKKHTLD